MHLKNTVVLDNTDKSLIQMVMTSYENKCYFMSIGLLRELDALVKISDILIRNKIRYNLIHLNSPQFHVRSGPHLQSHGARRVTVSVATRHTHHFFCDCKCEPHERIRWASMAPAVNWLSRVRTINLSSGESDLSAAGKSILGCEIPWHSKIEFLKLFGFV